jgi:hypothetical protein
MDGWNKMSKIKWGFLNSHHPAIRHLRTIGIGEIFAILAIAIPTTAVILMFVLQKWWVTIIITYEKLFYSLKK